jgi:hypothetical protein
MRVSKACSLGSIETSFWGGPAKAPKEDHGSVLNLHVEDVEAYPGRGLTKRESKFEVKKQLKKCGCGKESSMLT